MFESPMNTSRYGLNEFIERQGFISYSGLLYIGDSKMSAIEVRADLARKGDF